MKSKYALVAVGYNRIDSMKRLVQSLQEASYNENVDLIFSIDNSGTYAVEEYANSVIWRHGKKIIKTFPERLGLRNHILTCGDYVFSGYKAIAVFEDDIYVAPTFFDFMKQAVEYYQDDLTIAGISLYNHMWSEFNNRPFIAEKGKYDIYFLQYAQSWGQVWMPKQWKLFRDWYKTHNGDIVADKNTPGHILNWAKTSWLKYHIKYCIDTGKYFVYPYVSYTTNFVEVGQHCKFRNTLYQVPLMFGGERQYSFGKVNSADSVKYDAFFERDAESLGRFLGIEPEELTVNIYGNKLEETRYVINTKRINKKVLASYALELKPQEMNIFKEIPGVEIFLYDTSLDVVNNTKLVDYDLSRWYYESRVFDYKYIIRVICKIILRKIKERK